jgi:hypothetical protein
MTNDYEMHPEPAFLNFQPIPRNQFRQPVYESCSLAGRYDNPISIRFLSPIDCLTIPALLAIATFAKNLISMGEGMLNCLPPRG